MTLIEVLRSGKQADPDGVMVTLSRQAVEEAADLIERQQRELAEAQNLLRQTLPYLERHDDQGPLGYGWKSIEFEALIKQITKETQHGS